MQALFSAYRANDFADPEGFFLQAASVLSEFSEDVVLHVSSPKTGIQRRQKFPPTISEVLEACELHRDYLEKVEQRQRAKPRLVAPSNVDLAGGALANIFVAEGHPRYAGLVEKTKKVDAVFWRFGISRDRRSGLWVSLSMWNGEA